MVSTDGIVSVGCTRGVVVDISSQSHSVEVLMTTIVVTVLLYPQLVSVPAGIHANEVVVPPKPVIMGTGGLSLVLSVSVADMMVVGGPVAIILGVPVVSVSKLDVVCVLSIDTDVVIGKSILSVPELDVVVGISVVSVPNVDVVIGISVVTVSNVDIVIEISVVSVSELVGIGTSVVPVPNCEVVIETTVVSVLQPGEIPDDIGRISVETIPPEEVVSDDVKPSVIAGVVEASPVVRGNGGLSVVSGPQSDDVLVADIEAGLVISPQVV